MRLRELQHELQRDLLGEPSAIQGAILEAPPLPVEARLGIYRHAYSSRLIEALDEVYPVLHAVLGDETFQSLGELFVAARPSVHRSIRWYGRELADFMTTCSPFDEQPILAELARFEWTLSEVFDATDAAPLERSALAALQPDDWAGLSFDFHPSLRRLTFGWNTVAVWKAMSGEIDPPAPERAERAVEWLLWRRELENYFRSLEADESEALDVAIRGGTFAQVCEALGARLQESEIPLRAASLAGHWIDSGLVTGIAH